MAIGYRTKKIEHYSKYIVDSIESILNSVNVHFLNLSDEMRLQKMRFF